MVLIVDDQIGQVSRLLQMPAGVSEHCSVVRHYFVMVIRIFMLSTMINHHFHHCVIDHRYCKKLRDQFLATGGSRTINERGGRHWWAWTWKQSEFLMICGPVGGGDGSVVVVVVVVVVVGGGGCL